MVVPASGFTPAQISKLERLLRAGFSFVTLERFSRFIAVEKQHFVALLDPSGGKLEIFGQVGYRMGEGIGVLVERNQGKAFVWKGESICTSAEMLQQYRRIREELESILEPAA